MTYEDFIKEAGLARESFRWAWAFCNEVDGPITEPELADELLNLVLVGFLLLIYLLEKYLMCSRNIRFLSI